MCLGLRLPSACFLCARFCVRIETPGIAVAVLAHSLDAFCSVEQAWTFSTRLSCLARHECNGGIAEYQRPFRADVCIIRERRRDHVVGTERIGAHRSESMRTQLRIRHARVRDGEDLERGVTARSHSVVLGYSDVYLPELPHLGTTWHRTFSASMPSDVANSPPAQFRGFVYIQWARSPANRA